MGRSGGGEDGRGESSSSYHFCRSKRYNSYMQYNEGAPEFQILTTVHVPEEVEDGEGWECWKVVVWWLSRSKAG